MHSKIITEFHYKSILAVLEQIIKTQIKSCNVWFWHAEQQWIRWLSHS